MTDTQYAAPSPGGEGDRLPFKELLGALLRIDVIKHRAEGVDTEYGISYPILANVVALDGEHKGEEWADTLIFPRVLISRLKPNVGRVVLGRLGQGEKKPGKNPPWELTAPTDADIETAKKYDAYKASQVEKQEAPF